VIAARVGYAATLVLCVACVDTAPGLVVEATSASVRVTGSADGDVVGVDLVLDVRVGKHALAGDDFILPRASLFVDGAPIADVNLDRPEGFVGRLEPGESTTVSIEGESFPGAFPSARGSLCGAAIEVVVDWQAETQTDDPLDPPISQLGSATTTASATCD